MKDPGRFLLLFSILFALSPFRTWGAGAVRMSNSHMGVKSLPPRAHNPFPHPETRPPKSGRHRPRVFFLGSGRRPPYPQPRPDIFFVQTSPTTIVMQQPAVVVEQSSQTEVSGNQLYDVKKFKSDLDLELSKRLSSIKYLLKINSFSFDSGLYSANITLSAAIKAKNYNITSGAENLPYSDLKAYLLKEIANALAKIQSKSTTISVQN